MSPRASAPRPHAPSLAAPLLPWFALCVCIWLADSAASAPSAAPQDLITQELVEVEELLRLTEERASLLEQLRRGVQGHSSGGVAVDARKARALSMELPLLAEVVTDPKIMATAAAEDFLTSKAKLRFDRPAAKVKFLPIRVSKGSSTMDTSIAFPPALLVVAHDDGAVSFLSPSGEKLLTYESGHTRPVTALAVSPSWAGADMLVATGDAGSVVRVHRVTVKQRPVARPRSSGVDHDSVHLGSYTGSSVAVTVSFLRQLEALSGADGEGPKMTALSMASQQGSKYFVVGDAEGKISLFTLDGTFRSRLDAILTPGAGIESFYVHFGRLIFNAGSEWGFVDLDNLAVKHVECPDFEGRVVSAVIDSHFANRVLLADETGTIWAMAIRSARSCRVDHQFPRIRSRSPLELASIHGFLLAVDLGARGSGGGDATLVAINISHVGRKEIELPWGSSPIVWRITRPPLRSWAAFRHRPDGSESDVLALLSVDGKEVELFELLMRIYVPPSPPPVYLNSWVMLPSMISVICVAVSAHYLAYGRRPPTKPPE